MATRNSECPEILEFCGSRADRVDDMFYALIMAVDFLVADRKANLPQPANGVMRT
jgi:hypothetical protein